MLGAREKVAMHVNATVASTIPPRTLDDLNWLRGLAAVSVLAGHVRGLFFNELPPTASLFRRLVYLVTGFGHQAVVVFFVLSGFFVGTSVVVTTREGTWSWKRFALRRFTRLYVVLLPALALTAAWDLLGTNLFGLHAVYSGHIDAPFLTPPDVRVSLTLPVFLGNVAFLQDFAVVPFGSNGPLWSLSYEFWAYLTFPLLFRAAFGNAPPGLRVLSALSAGVVLLAFGEMFRFYFSVWALGAVVAFAWTVRPVAIKNPVVPVLVAVLFTAALLVARGRSLHRRLLEDFLLGVATALLVAVRLAAGAGRTAETRDRGALSRAYSRWGDVLAGFSYTLYASHYPLVTIMQAWLVGPRRWEPGPTLGALATLTGFGIIALYAYPLARLTEARTDDVRRWLERRLVRAEA
jgi:peptidoglycan/LPS O-acetylase OafA/YrhL